MEYAHNELCSFWNVLKMKCALECALFGMWSKYNVSFLECDQIGMGSKWNVLFSECVQMECALFRMWSNGMSSF